MAESREQSTLFGEEPRKKGRERSGARGLKGPAPGGDGGPAPAGVYVRVVVERGIESGEGAHGYTYRCDAAVRVGDRVRVPLGRGNTATGGYVVEVGGPELAEGVSGARIKAVLDVTPANFSDAMLGLARWMSAYYVCPLGMVLSAMMPAAVKRGTGIRSERVFERAETGVDAAVMETLSKKTRELVIRVMSLPREMFPAAPKRLAAELGLKTAAPLKRAEEIGVLRTVMRERLEGRGFSLPEVTGTDTPPPLTAAQGGIVEGIGATLDRFGVHLLRGVTGSGKTEVYLRLIERVLGAGKTAIVLVPEIALTPQTSARFLRRFSGHGVCVLHSGLSASQRHAEWDRAARGAARVVVGARSAVFAPLANLGLIVVDEEHDSSYKQDQLPRYHGRDAAIKRAQLEGCPVVLGSATPSLESWANAKGARDVHAAQAGRAGSPLKRAEGDAEREGDGRSHTTAEAVAYERASPLKRAEESDAEAAHMPIRGTTGQGAAGRSGGGRFNLWELPDRVVGRMPPVEIVDLTEERKVKAQMDPSSRTRQWSIGPRLEAAVVKTLGAGGQVILLLNRRGFAHYIACLKPACGWVLGCDQCDARLVFHKHADLPRGGDVACHHCLARQLLPRACPDCGGPINIFGAGTQRVEEEVARIVESCGMTSDEVIRADSDSMGSARDYFEALGRFARGDAKVLLGTQMIAKGLDFPNVQLVGVVSADTALSLPDFRSGERTFQLVSQVAGRAGRGPAGGRVIVQTMEPRNSAIVYASRHDYVGFADRELASRREWGLPPATRMARIVCRDASAVKARESAGEIAEALRGVGAAGVRVLGPMECPINRTHGQFRYAAEVIAPSATELNGCLAALRASGLLISDAKTAVDVDPVALM